MIKSYINIDWGEVYIMDESNLNAVASLSQMINEYGFVIVFAGAMLMLIIIVAVMCIKKLSLSMELRYQQEAKKVESETKMIESRRQFDVDQQSKLLDLVTNVQSQQVSQLQNISNVITLVKEELKLTSKALDINNITLDDLNKSVTDIITKYENVAETISDVDKHSILTESKIDDMIDSINTIKELLIKLNEKANKK